MWLTQSVSPISFKELFKIYDSGNAVNEDIWDNLNDYRSKQTNIRHKILNLCTEESDKRKVSINLQQS